MTDTRRRAEMFLDAEDDPREDGPTVGDERAMLVGFLRTQRSDSWRGTYRCAGC